MNTYLFYSFCLLIGYLIGSILFARLITRLATGQNILELGNHNPGAYNVFRNVGKGWGILVGILDAGKALFPMLIARYAFHLQDDIALGCLGIGALLGHGYPLYYHFEGGRAASILMGMLIFFVPYEFLFSFLIGGAIVLLFIKKEYGIWGPTLIIAFSAISCLFFPHTVEVKIIIWIGALITLFFNRDAVQERTKKLSPVVKKK
ncbi:MAG TPA: glycerol-3-phosphate acyltransferase [Paludibacteraceae bacterium]|nr:glycerol-3-phosphate acyltransferase [Paludibacteraceae bacterium]HRU63081.1 glycerol-3-phosphate acyltransferase [Paludibacteraceae bacterium]